MSFYGTTINAIKEMIVNWESLDMRKVTISQTNQCFRDNKKILEAKDNLSAERTSGTILVSNAILRMSSR